MRTTVRIACSLLIGFAFDVLQARYKDSGFKVVAISLDSDEQAASAFAGRHPSHFFVGMDPTGHSGEVFDVAAMPTAFLIDGEGRILARFAGGTDAVHKEISDAVDRVLSGKPLETANVHSSKGSTRSGVRAWERGYLADPIMSLDGDVLSHSIRDHIFTSKEAAAGDGAVAGGGCGCN